MGVTLAMYNCPSAKETFNSVYTGLKKVVIL